MPVASLHRIHADDTADALARFSDLVHRSGAVPLIENAKSAVDQTDVDTPEDLRLLRLHLALVPEAAPHTAAALRDL